VHELAGKIGSKVATGVCGHLCPLPALDGHPTFKRRKGKPAANLKHGGNSTVSAGRWFSSEEVAMGSRCLRRIRFGLLCAGVLFASIGNAQDVFNRMAYTGVSYFMQPSCWDLDTCTVLASTTVVTPSFVLPWGSQPSWSPDGTRIAFAFAGHIYIADSTGSATKITSALSNGSPAWSPDGDRIAFANSRDGTADLYTIRSAGVFVPFVALLAACAKSPVAPNASVRATSIIPRGGPTTNGSDPEQRTFGLTAELGSFDDPGENNVLAHSSYV
jgi:WD40-like Beta Propeller Repeat